MTPGMMTRDLASKNIGVRGLTGQGEPGLHTLLGGGEGQDEAGGGSSSGAAYARRAASHMDKRLTGVLAAAIADSRRRQFEAGRPQRRPLQ